jgi:hypothetical protein
MAKRSAINLGGMLAKRAREDEKHVNDKSSKSAAPSNPYLSRPAAPEQALYSFLTQAVRTARNNLPRGTTLPVKEPFCEIEARIGILKAPFGVSDRRVASSGPKHVNGRTYPTFNCSDIEPRCGFESGITRSHNVHWTQAGLSEVSPISHALGVKEDVHLKRDLVEHEYVETVYGGYPGERRVVFPGMHPSSQKKIGKMEHKERLDAIDLAVPAAPYDIRIQLATEKAIDNNLQNAPPPGWTNKRVKRRRSYSRRDKSIKWQIDVTEVTTTFSDPDRHAEVAYELEMELLPDATMQLVNDGNEKFCKMLASQLWWILHNINPLSDVLDVEEFLQDHPDRDEVQLALAACGAMKKFMESKGSVPFSSPIGRAETPPASLAKLNFCGCMPVNFSRHNIEEVQRSAENGYFLSEKTDGVRHFLVFTNKTAVLVDRAMRGKQPIHRPGSDKEKDPFDSVLGLIRPGTILDGEVVMHRKHRRPIFIVFDVMTINTETAVLQLKFEDRLRHLRQASFRTKTADRDMFDPRAVADPKIALPLIRKNFVQRKDLDDLLSKVTEEKGSRAYRQGETHYHLTDGIIFQPNLPYVCGTDVNLLKWKYLDTVTIDVEILPPLHNDEEGTLRVGVLGEEQTRIDMTRHIHLPSPERRRLEADRQESGSKIAEVGFDPTTGAWYYLTMRPDKIAPNHISTVLGTLLELAEFLTTEELRYRMSIPPGSRDTYGKDVRGMQKQLLEHQRNKNKVAHQHPNGHAK